MCNIRQAGLLAAIVATALTNTAIAQTGGAVSGTVRAGTRITTAVPRITVPAQGATRTTTSVSARGASGTTIATGSTIRAAVAQGTRALLAGLALTAEQSMRIEAEAQSYANALGAAAQAQAHAQTEAALTTTGTTADASRERTREAAARYRARVRALLKSEQQATFDANVRAGVTAEVDLGRASASADNHAGADASATGRADRARPDANQAEPARSEPSRQPR